ncbi:MAG: SLC13 family permease [Rhodospirillales bacterium]
MTSDGITALVILGLAIVAFASNRLRVDAVALAVLLALAITGLVNPAEAIAGFSDSSVLMIGGLFIVGEGLVTTGVAAAVGEWLGKVGHESETRLILVLMVVVAAVGAFMSSTGIVAMFIPVILGLVSRGGYSRSRLMMPLSVAALISGLMTLIATAPNLVVSAALSDRGLAPFGFFELTPIGVAILIVAVAYMLTVGRRLLTRAEPTADRTDVSVEQLIDRYGLTGRFRAMRIGPASSLAGRSVAEAQVRSRYGVTLVAISRTHRSRIGVQPALTDSVMRVGDRIAVTADPKVLARFAAAERLYEEPTDERLRSAAGQQIGVAEVMLAPEAPLIGKTLRDAEFRKRRGLTVLAIKHRGKVLPQENLIDAPLDVGDLILVAGAWPLIARLQNDHEEFVVLRLPKELKSIPPRRNRATAALVVLAGMILAMTTGLLPNVIAVLLAALAMVAAGCVPAGQVYRSIGWSTLVLIAGMLPLATALENTGVTAVMASGLTQLLAELGPYAMLSVLFLITAVVGLFISNTATAVLIAPVAINAAQDLSVSSHAFAVTVAVACSCAFVTPVSSPVNTLVLEPGHYTFNDFVKVGLPLLVLSLIITVVMVGLLYPLVPTTG